MFPGQDNASWGRPDRPFNAFNRYITLTGLTFIASLVALVLWRLWSFTVLPILHPKEPKELPYWLPYLGHAIEYVRNGQDVITYGRKYFKNTREPFALTLCGEKIYVLTSPEDVAAAYKSTTTLAFDRVVYDLSITFGVSHASMDKAYKNPTTNDNILSSKLNLDNRQLKSLTQMNSDFYKMQLHPGEKFKFLQRNFLYCIDNSIRPENLAGSYVLSSSEDGKTVSLLKWSQDILLNAATKAFFGEKLLQLDLDLFSNFLDFDNENWKLWYKWPQAKEMHAAKAKVTESILEYIKLPREERMDAAWLIQIMETTQRAIGMTDQDIATVLTMVYFVVNTNTYKVCFWVMAYVAHLPSLLETIRTETAPAMLTGGGIDTSYLHNHCPHLESLFNEVLRFASASSSIRTVVAPTVIGGKLFRPGARVICPFRQLHYNDAIYGPDVEVFDPDRFMQNKTLAHSSSYRPFGGGTSYCPGRFIARQEVYYVVALMLHRFNIGLAAPRPGYSSDGKQAFPAMDSARPTTGLMCPAPGDDVFLIVKPPASGVAELLQ